jgi:hypothetical protein
MGLKHPERLVKVSVTITEQQNNALIRHMLAHDCSLSHLAREIFQAWIERHKS